MQSRSRFWGLLLLSWCTTTQASQEAFRCFDVPQTTADRSSVRITIGQPGLSWVSHDLVDTIAELALRELLGYTVVRWELPNAYSFGAALSANLADTDLEQWTNPLGDAQYRDYVSRTGRVHDLGTIGYVGRSAIWTLRTAVELNAFADYYKFYLNESAAKAGSFLTFGNSGDSPNDTYCEPGPFRPWCEASGLDGYWATPACRTHADSCLLVLHYSTFYDGGYFEQLFRNNRIRAVFGYYGDNFFSRVRSVAAQSRFPLFYWWQPDPFLLELDAVRVSFPDYFTGCDVKLGHPDVIFDAENGTVKCDYGAKTLWKAVSNRVRDSAPEAFYFLKRLLITADQMDSLLRATLEPNEEVELRTACDFIKDNMALFRSFAPECITHPPSPVRDGDLVFDPGSLRCESRKVFQAIGSTYCFADSERPGTTDRSDRTIRLARRSWATHDIVSMVSEVILREYLGFNVELVYNNRTHQMQAPVEILEGYYDADMEVWLPNDWELNPEHYSPDLDLLVTGEIEVVGFTGFSGRSGLFIRQDVLESNPLLDFYKAYVNASQLQSIVTYSDTRLQEVLQNDFPECDATIWSWCGEGDLEGAWAPPKCEAEPGHCVEIVHNSPSHDQGLVEQLVRNLGLEAVVAYYGNAGASSLLLSQVGTGIASPFFWWEPDPLLLALDAVRISFPDFYLGCNSGDTRSPSGTVACDFPGVELRKVATASLRDSAPEAYYAIVHLDICKTMVNDVLAVHQSMPLAEAVCEWLAEHPRQIEMWAPPCLTAQPDQVNVGDWVFDAEALQCAPVVCGVNEVLRYIAASRTYFCDPCSNGTVPNSKQTLCQPCPAGQEVRGGICHPCDPGSFKSAGFTVCESCADGRFTTASGQSNCRFCNSSSYQDERGALDCKLCDEVILGGVTPILGAPSSSFCQCQQGTYLPWNSLACEVCPLGLECPEGADARNLPNGSSGTGLEVFVRPYPKAQQGYMTILGEPFEVYKCLVEDHCPGGPPGSCAQLRDSSSVACGRCIQGAYTADNGCARCKSLDTVPFLVGMLIVLVVSVIAAFVTNRNLLMKTSALLMVVILTGIAITTLQTMIVFKQISVIWFRPFNHILQALKIISFELEALRKECVLGNDEVRQYTFRQLVAPVCIMLLCTTLAIKKRFRPQMVVACEFVNTVGTIFNIFFISIIISCVAPLVCYHHPGSTNRSVVGTPAMLCDFKDDHAYVVTVGGIALLCIPGPFLALVAFGITQYPRYVTGTLDAHLFLASFRFLFVRFKPTTYYFGAVVVARGLCCCLVPVVIDRPAVQVVMMALSISTYLLVQQLLKPWRTQLANIVDGMLGFLLLLLLLCLAILTDLTGTQAVPAVAMVGFACTVIVPAACIAYTCIQKSFPNSYHVFISHHKADAAAQARLLKMLLTAMTGKRIFIDSDDLVELDQLFDIVKTSVKLLLVYLTKYTLTRPWCVGEITTNWACNGRVATVKTPSFIQPSEAEARQLYRLVDNASCNLQEQGITLQAMSLALGNVVMAPTVRVNAALTGSRRYLTVAKSVAQNEWNREVVDPVGSKRNLTSAPANVGAVVLSADYRDDEAVATASILGKKIEVLVDVEGGVTNLLDVDAEIEHLEASRACIVVLSRGTLIRKMQVVIIVCGMSSVFTEMIPVVLWDFKFPAPTFYEQILPGMWSANTGANAGRTVEEAQVGTQAFFTLIAISFSTMASERILDLQARQVVENIPRHYAGKGSGSKSSLLKDSFASVRALASGRGAEDLQDLSEESDDDESLVSRV